MAVGHKWKVTWISVTGRNEKKNHLYTICVEQGNRETEFG